MMDSKEYFYAMYHKRLELRARSREQFEMIRFQEFLNIQANPYVKKKPTKPVDMIKFVWEFEKKMSVEEMKEAFHQIVASYTPPKVRKLKNLPPPHLRNKDNEKKGKEDAS